MNNKYDLLVLGGGSGGIASANRAGMHGAKVAVIEGNLLGGTCVNRGCVPKKVGWYASHIQETLDQIGPGYGFEIKDYHFDYQKFTEARDYYVDRSRAGYDRAFKANGVDLIQGYGRFISNSEIQVNGQIYSADHIIIATGGRPYTHEVEGSHLLENSDDVFKWTSLPKSVAFIGAGYVAVELAQMYQSLGVDAHLVVRYDRPLRKFDSMLTDNLMEYMDKSGLKLYTHTDFDKYSLNDQGFIDCYKDDQIVLTVEKVVAAIGRRPNSDHIGLENTDVQVDEKGNIIVDDEHRTGAGNIYAIGDVIDRIDLTPVAIRAGRQISEHLFNHAESSTIDYSNVPTVIFSHPAIATVGYSQEQAEEKFGKDQIKIYQSRFNAMFQAVSGERQACDFKLVCHGPEEKVIGLHGIGYGVDEMLQGFALALKLGATKKEWDSIIAIHPTGAEEFVTMR